MPRSRQQTEILSPDFDEFTSDLAMAMWNRITEFPPFSRLKPNDFPQFYETLKTALKPYCVKESKT